MDVKRWKAKEDAIIARFKQTHAIPVTYKFGVFDRIFMKGVLGPLLCLPCCLYGAIIRVATCTPGGNGCTYLTDTCISTYYETMDDITVESYDWIKDVSANDRVMVKAIMFDWLDIFDALDDGDAICCVARRMGCMYSNVPNHHTFVARCCLM